MRVEGKHRQGTSGWFEMVGKLMTDAASRAGLAPDADWSLVERYVDGVEVADGLAQGIRFDVRGGKPSFRVGVRPDEKGAVTIEISAASARALNLLRSGDPAYGATLERVLRNGDMRIEGDLSPMADWLAAVHDPIVDRTL